VTHFGVPDPQTLPSGITLVVVSGERSLKKAAPAIRATITTGWRQNYLERLSRICTVFTARSYPLSVTRLEKNESPEVRTWM